MHEPVNWFLSNIISEVPDEIPKLGIGLDKHTFLLFQHILYFLNHHFYTPSTKYIGVYSVCLFCNYVWQFVCKLFFLSKISQQILELGF